MKNLVFDFDGVLADTWEAVIHGLVESGRTTDRETAIKNATRYANEGSHHTKHHTLTAAEMAAEHEWVHRFGKIVHTHGFALFTDFISAIESLDDARIAVVSSGSLDYVLPALKQTKLNPTHVLAFEDHHSKEEKIDRVCRDWQIPVSEAYYFTDTLADIYELKGYIAAEKLIGVAWGYCGKDTLLQELPQQNILVDQSEDIRMLF